MVKLMRALTGAAVVCATMAVAAQAQAPERAPVTAQAIRVVSDASGGVAVSIEVSAPAATRAFVLSGDRPRFVVDVSGARWRPQGLPAGRGEGPGAGFASGFRYADHDTGVSRLVLDLSAPGVLGGVSEQALPNGRMLVTAVVRPAAPGAPAQAAPAPAPGGIVLAAASPAPVSRRAVIVIDAGHGGRDPGAIGVSGVREKDITLDAALRLRDLLEATGRYHVVLTRDADIFLPLPARLAAAREAGADLFISLHADASENAATRGASVYTISERGEARGRRLAQDQDWDLAPGEPVESATVEDILLDLSQRETTSLSGRFALALIEELEPVAPLLRNTHRNAGFFVLLAPDVPAVLLEMGFLTNAEDEARLSDPQERQRLVGAVAAAVDAHFTARPALVLAQQ